MNNSILGSFMRKKRKDMNLTLREMAEFTGVSYSHLSKIERGEHQPSHDTIGQLAKVFNINRDEMYAMVHFTRDELDFWRDIYIKKYSSKLNPYEQENVTALEVIKFRNSVVHSKSTPDIKITDDQGNLIYFEVKSESNKINEKFSNRIESYQVSNDDTDLDGWKELIFDSINKGLTVEKVQQLVESNAKDKLIELAFEVLAAQSTMFSSEVQYYHLKEIEGVDSFTTMSAYGNFLEAQGYYNGLLHKYMIEYFKYPNANPFQDRLLKKKFPIEYQTQHDLFNGVSVTLKCADGHLIKNVAYHSGGIGNEIEVAEEKARKYIEKHLKHFKLK